MKKDKYIVGIGAANADIYCKSNIKIRPHYDHPSVIKTSVGGVTRNILENLARLNQKTILLTAVGDDIYGDLIINKSNAVGIDTSNVRVLKNKNSGIFVQVQDSNNDMHLASCDMSICKYIDIKYIKSKDKVISKASVIILDPSLDLKVIEYILDKYKDIPIFVDPISDEYALKIRPYLSKIYCIKPNKRELSVLANMKIKSNADLNQAFNKVNKKIKELYVSVGKDGCLFKNNNKVVNKKFKEIKKMVNASGAGDGFTSALVYGYINSLSAEETIDYALSAGIAAIKSEASINPKMSVKLLRKIIMENKNEL